MAGDCWQSVQRVSELFEHKEKQRLQQQTRSVKEKDRIRKQYVALLLLPVVTCDDARCESLIALVVGCSDLCVGSCLVSDIFSCHH